MKGTVNFFRRTFVEGRFIPSLGVLGFLLMRTLLFLYADPFRSSLPLTDNHLWNPLSGWFADPLISFLASTVSIFAIAWVLSLMNSRFNLVRARSYLPFVAPLFLFSLHPCFLVMSGDYVAILFILFAFFPLLESYQQPDSYLYSFRSAVLIGLASLFQVFALWLLPLWWSGERSMRGGQSRSFIASLFGLSLVYVTLFSVYFFTDDLAGFARPFLHFASFSFPSLSSFSTAEWGVFFLGLLFFVFNIALAAKIYMRDKVLTLVTMRFVVFLVVAMLLLSLIYWEHLRFFLLFAISLVSILNAYLYTRTQVKRHIYMAYGWLLLMLLFYGSSFVNGF
ncbi:MAG TPA: hypothetical protein GXZ56_07585 [Bacteroidales bacterium]|jgi:hypothetical protein|nr:hypothetical protein [Bacteroidales bacterium]